MAEKKLFVRCCYCDALIKKVVLAPEDTLSDGSVSHGVCKLCKPKIKEEIAIANAAHKKLHGY